MRLFLASYRFGDRRRAFEDLTDGPGPIAVIGNAGDSWPVAARASAMTSDMRPLLDMGYAPDEVDLRDYIGEPDALHEKLTSFRAIWVRGGNTFVLRAQLHRSGGDRVVCDLLDSDAIVYAGYSAGACVLAPTLAGIEFSDDPAEVDQVTGSAARWDGLGVVPFAIIPHWQSVLDPNDEGRRAAQYYEQAGIPYRTLTDNDVIVIDGEPV